MELGRVFLILWREILQCSPYQQHRGVLRQPFQVYVRETVIILVEPYFSAHCVYHVVTFPTIVGDVDLILSSDIKNMLAMPSGMNRMVILP